MILDIRKQYVMEQRLKQQQGWEASLVQLSMRLSGQTTGGSAQAARPSIA
jgi:hypothetical protein